MRNLASVLIAISLLVPGLAGGAYAAGFEYQGELQLDLGALPPAVITGTGIAIANGGGAGGHLDSLKLLGGGINGNVVVPVTDPVVTQGGIVSIRATGTLGTGTLAPVSGALQNTSLQLTDSTLPVYGSAHLCLVYAGCNSGQLEVPFTANGTRGFGIGGLITAGGAGSIRVSVLAAPWTVKVASALNRTDNGAISTPSVHGFAHGPASLTSSTALTSGVVQFVTPLQVTTAGLPGNNDLIALLGHLRLHFVPEPGMLLLLASGVGALVLLGRQRRR
jgi:hypothetical protein